VSKREQAITASAFYELAMEMALQKRPHLPTPPLPSAGESFLSQKRESLRPK